jgi:predicted DNA-binding protein with PD1-like motif
VKSFAAIEAIGMRYSVGHIGRVVVAKLEDDEDVLTALESLTEKEKIKSALFVVIGNLKKGSLVSGAETEKIPVIPIWQHFTTNHEILGIGTIFQMDGKSKIHLHAALVHGGELLGGCLREKSEVFLVAELIVLELLDVSAQRARDEKTGFTLLKVG